MRDLILIPTYYRPEFLSLCLEHLSKAEGILDNKEVWVCQDMREHDEHRHYLEEQWTAAVIEEWRTKLPIRFIRQGKHIFSGNSLNVMKSYKAAFAEKDVRYVYLVEDDVFVMPDFFKWHEALQQEGDFMCSVAYRCSRNQEAIAMEINDPNAYFLSSRDYASIGVCWKREKLAPIVKHCVDEYFENLDGYMLRTFPGNRFAGDFAEQDGLIMRVLWETKGIIAWSFVPRVFHMGWYGYHRPNGQRPNGHLDQKISILRGLIHNQEQLKIVAPDFGDIEAMPRDSNLNFNKLHKVCHFE